MTPKRKPKPRAKPPPESTVIESQRDYALLLATDWGEASHAQRLQFVREFRSKIIVLLSECDEDEKGE